MTDTRNENGPGGEPGPMDADQASGDNAMPKDGFADSRADGKGKVRDLCDLVSVRGYLNRIGAKPTSLSRAVVREQAGTYQKDIATIKFGPDGTVTCRAGEDYLPNEDEQKSIKAEWATCRWPEIMPLHAIGDSPDMIRNADPQDLFEFRNRQNRITWVEVRVEDKAGGKRYVPWTYWDDGQWRNCEPPDELPLWGLERLHDVPMVFLHEGPKAARAVREMVEARTREAKAKLAAHPWGEQLQCAVHLGWAGGAPNPGRTDWSVLRKAGVTRVYVVADNDVPGEAAVPRISKALAGLPVYAVRFGDDFPSGFDLADPFPEKLFRAVDGATRYAGPSFFDCVHPATWATRLVQTGQRGRPAAKLLPAFLDTWGYAEDTGQFFDRQHPERRFTEDRFNNAVRPFSDVQKTSSLLVEDLRSHVSAIDYRPDKPSGKFAEGGRHLLNGFRPGAVRSVQGDVQPFLDLFEHLFPIEEDRRVMLRWVATLVARPDVRMGYGVLLISERQGVGKTTLAASILKPLVGPWNTSEPRAEEVAGSRFNGWAAEKRLVVINELYSQQGSRATYDAMKSLITEDTLSVERKGQDSVVMRNWVHVFATSNTLQCLHLVDEDRRWFVPTVTEELRPRDVWVRLHAWLANGGLEAVRSWANEYPHWVRAQGWPEPLCACVAPGEHAPDSSRKRQMVEESLSPGARDARALAEALMAQDRPALVLGSDVLRWVRARRQGEAKIEAEATLRKAMKGVDGIKVTPHDKRPKVDGVRAYVISNYDLGGETRWKEGGLAERRIAPEALVSTPM